MSPLANETASTQTVALRRWRRIAIFGSVAFHVCLLTVLAVWVVGRRQADRRAADQAAADMAARETKRRESLPSPEVTSQQVAATIDRARENYASATTAEQLTALDKQAAKLEAVSTEKGVAEIAEKFEDWAAIRPRAGTPAAEPVAGEFDFDTAQIHDVLRTAADDGTWIYHSILVDAQGRTYQVELNGAEGEKAYATFESLKKFPLANQVYRQIAMALMDQALQNDRATAAPGAASPTPTPAPDDETATEVDDRDPFDNSDD